MMRGVSAAATQKHDAVVFSQQCAAREISAAIILREIGLVEFDSGSFVRQSCNDPTYRRNELGQLLV